MTYLRAGIKPDWLAATDRTVEADDQWQEATDPQNERGEECLAHLKRIDVPCYEARHGCFDGAGFELLGLSIRDTTGTIYRDRAWAMKILGPDAVWHIEQHESEAA